MKKILASAAVLLLSSSAFAADQVYIDPAPAAAPAAVYDWSGVYIGLHIGGGWGDADLVFPTVPSASNTDVDGIFGGAQVGYDYQAGNWVFGAVADFSASGIDGTSPCPNAAFNCPVDVNWLATVRARAGYAANNWLFYATGGLSIADVDYDAISVATGLPFGPTVNDTATGYNVGGGVEWAFQQNWSAGLEYLYHDFSSSGLTAATFGSAGTGDLDLHTVKFSLNYRF